LMHQQIDPKAAIKPIGKGLAASPGAAVGQVVFTATDAQSWHGNGKKVIMVRLETSPEDLAGMNAAAGILTVRGGMTSHAAVVARGMGKCCVSGCGDIVLNGKQFTLHGHTFKEGDWISIDGTRGLIYKGKAPMVDPSFKGVFSTVLGWCKEYKRLGVRANADTPKDSDNAVAFGADGIGLCRTEHMFFGGTRIDAMRQMILAEDEAGRIKALKVVEPLQRADFVAIFKSMGQRPVTIRLLDPPLHEFVPHELSAQADLAGKMGVPVEKVSQRVRSLHESNPMLGHRGCRLGISYPEIYNMQVRAIIEAALEVGKSGLVVSPEIMIPLVGKREELEFTKAQAIKTAEAVIASRPGAKVNYTIGTMIEVPRAAVTADEIAKEADFFSFGTNDLTQMGCGFSRDDSGPFLNRYVALGIYNRDPFQSLDQEGVGELIRIAICRGRRVKPMLKVGICGEHGGDPRTILFCHKVGMNYVSCSPFRVPTAIVAAAQAALLEVEEANTARKKFAAGSKL
jgi:pyruvate, orthophosphate dikinase